MFFFWRGGGFTYSAPKSLVPVDRMINFQKYVDILSSEVVPILNHLYSDRSSVFQQDLTPRHTSKKVKKSFEDAEVIVIDWPGNLLV